MEGIKHVWFDFSDTLTALNQEEHAKLRYGSYADTVGRPVTEELKNEYDALKNRLKSHSAVFVSLGKPVEYWSERYAAAGSKLYTLAESDIPEVLEELHKRLPISLFSNVLADKFLPGLGISPELFTNILGPREVKKPKPDPEGFHLIVERSQIPVENLLFVGDDVEKELRPAKSVGMQTGIMWGNSSETDYSFGHFREILDIV